MILREFRQEDQPGIVSLQEEFMNEFFPEYADDPRQYEWNADAYDVNQHYIQKGGKVWVVDDDNHIAGFGCVRIVDSHTAEIKRVRINAQYRGKGWGSTIIEKIEEHCANYNFRRLLVDTEESLKAARSMYDNMGYTVYRTNTETEDGTEYTQIFYEKLL